MFFFCFFFFSSLLFPSAALIFFLRPFFRSYLSTQRQKELDWFLEDAVASPPWDRLQREQQREQKAASSSSSSSSPSPVVSLRSSLPDLSERWEARIKERLPFQYAVGIAHWRRVTLAVGSGVLCPRPETEQLVDLAAAAFRGMMRKAEEESSRSSSSPPLSSLPWTDLGTGSGAIAVGLALDALVVSSSGNGGGGNENGGEASTSSSSSSFSSSAARLRGRRVAARGLLGQAQREPPEPREPSDGARRELAGARLRTTRKRGQDKPSVVVVGVAFVNKRRLLGGRRLQPALHPSEPAPNSPTGGARPRAEPGPRRRAGRGAGLAQAALRLRGAGARVRRVFGPRDGGQGAGLGGRERPLGRERVFRGREGPRGLVSRGAFCHSDAEKERELRGKIVGKLGKKKIAKKNEKN